VLGRQQRQRAHRALLEFERGGEQPACILGKRVGQCAEQKYCLSSR
jgi:hypothetical protein